MAGSWFGKVRERLIDERLSALIHRNEMLLRCGRNADIVEPLLTVIEDRPTDERPVAQLMLALYRCGRAAEAQEHYRLIRRRLNDLQGIEPSAVLRRLHERILRDDPGLIDPQRAAAWTPVTPAGLPHDVPGLLGRRSALDKLDEVIGVDPGPSGRIVVVDGTAGVGKTTLAVHWANRVRDRFPDGSLFANLNGYGPGSPIDSGRVLDGFLTSLGVAPDRLPPTLDAKASLYRSLLDRRHLLILLDNAATADQVRPMLPATPECLVLITSRGILAGLGARDRAQRITLDVLSPSDSLALLAQFVGDARIVAERGAAIGVADACGHLPLALCVAGQHAAMHPTRGLTDLSIALADHRRRLDTLDADGDPHADVRSVLSWSYRRLPTPAARMFRMFGLHPGPDIDRYAAAAMTGSDLHLADRLLDALVHAHLAQELRPGRFSMHDLLRDYAAERAALDEPEALRRDAICRLLAFYLHTSAAAVISLYPEERPHLPHVPAPPAATLEVTQPDQARHWLDAERTNLLATVTTPAVAHGQPDYIVHLSTILFRYLNLGYWADGQKISQQALTAARTSGNDAAQARALTNLGLFTAVLGSTDEALHLEQQALSLARGGGDRSVEARALLHLAIVYGRLQRYDDAESCLSECIDMARRIGDQNCEVWALNNLGVLRAATGHYTDSYELIQQCMTLAHRAGDHSGDARWLCNVAAYHVQMRHLDEALDYAQQALTAARTLGDMYAELQTLDTLGVIYSQLDRNDEAQTSLELALDLCSETCGLGEKSDVLNHLGLSYARQNRYHEACQHAQHALATARTTGDRRAQADIMNTLGYTLRLAGDLRQSLQYHRDALAIATHHGARDQQARAHDGLAQAFHRQGHQEQAEQHWQDALTIYTDLDLPESQDIAEALRSTNASLAPPAPGSASP
jgi:tetratricopeptide (TPR) repeat protein